MAVCQDGENAKSSSSKEDVQHVQTLLAAASDRQTCAASLSALEAVTLRNGACHKRVLDVGATKALTTVMAEHLKDAEIQTLACRTMQHLASAAQHDGAAQLAQAGACAAARFAMDAHPQDVLVQQVACHALELI